MLDDLKFNSLNSAKYLYLQDLSEPRDNSLRLIVQEAVVNLDGIGHLHPSVPELDEISTHGSPIECTPACRSFELIWDHCIAYLVTEEMVGSCGNYDDEQFTGRVFRVYSKSHFLDHLAKDTGGHSQQVRHYKLTCLNHLIDVAAYNPPEITIIAPLESAQLRIQ